MVTLTEVLQMHPRDYDTWILLDIQEHLAQKQESGIAAAREELRKRMGG